MAVAPGSVEETAALLAEASAARRTVMPVGGGTHARRGRPAAADVELSTAGLDAIVAHEPADLTVTVQGGVRVETLDAALAAAGQCWPQAELRPGSTIGGAIAASASDRARLRNGPIRDGVLEVVVATGDGRVIKAGGKTVKGVAGYDLCRVMVGSHGSLGVIVEVTLKLWPRPPASGWFLRPAAGRERGDAARSVLATIHRPACVLLRRDGLWLRLDGPAGDVAAPPGFGPAESPPPPTGTGVLAVGVPPARIDELARELDALGGAYEALAGVGSAKVAVDDLAGLRAVREIATRLGGHAVVADAPDDLRVDPWGPPPPGIEIMRRVKAAFDPAGIMAPGKLVGGRP